MARVAIRTNERTRLSRIRVGSPLLFFFFGDGLRWDALPGAVLALDCLDSRRLSGLATAQGSGVRNLKERSSDQCSSSSSGREFQMPSLLRRWSREQTAGDTGGRSIGEGWKGGGGEGGEMGGG